MLTFDEASHEYRVDGVLVPSVTQIMGALRDFAGIPAEHVDRAAERGENTHLACHLDDRGLLDEASISDEIRPYLDAWRAFRQAESPMWFRREEPLYSGLLGYAGTPDCHGHVLDGEYVVEIKSTAQLHPAFGVQLHGYRSLISVLDKTEMPSIGRAVVHLLRTGKYRVVIYNDPLDAPTFASCLTIHNWRTKWKL